MPVKEESFRIGCGRYTQKCGNIETLGDEVLRFGVAPLIVGGKTALEVTQAKIEDAIKEKCLKFKIIEHRGTCNEEDARLLAEYARNNAFDVVVGVGGGVLMDFAKLIAFFAKCPIINVPTSSATCAAYTPLSVQYTVDGKTVGTRHFEKEVDAVLVDSEIISAQPARLFLSGVFDALAKFLEIKHRFNEEAVEYPLGLDWAYIISKKTFDELCKKTPKALKDMQRGNVTDTVEQVIFITIAVTGVISGIARGSNQTALAHKFYEITRMLFPNSSKRYLHGEIVGVGLLLQNHFNGEEKNNEFILQIMQEYEMPYNIAGVGVDSSEEIFEEYYNRICNSSAIDMKNPAECKKFKESLYYFWESNK